MPIVSSTSDLRSLVVAGNDGDFGERVVVRPQTSHQYGGVIADPAQPEFVVEKAHVMIKSGQADAGGSGSKTWSLEVGTTGTTISIDRALNPQAMSIKTDDIICAVERPGEPEFLVTRPDLQERNRLVFQVSEK